MELSNTKKLDAHKEGALLIVDFWGTSIKISKKALATGVWETIPDRGQVWATAIRDKIDPKSIIPTQECKITPPPKPVQQSPVSEQREVGKTTNDAASVSVISNTSQTTSLVADKNLDLKNTSITCTNPKAEKEETKLSQVDVERIYNEIIAKADKGVKALIEKEDNTRKCSVCGGEVHHAMWTPMSFSTWYFLDEETNKVDEGKPTKRAIKRKGELQAHIKKYGPCSCGYRAIPKEGCNVFRRKRIQGESHGNRAKFNRQRKKDNKKESKEYTMDEKLVKANEELKKKLKYSFEFDVETDAPDTQGEHLVPLSAGGCPTSVANPFKIEDENHKFNIVKIWQLCSFCQHLDELFTEWQRENELHDWKYYETILGYKFGV